MPKLNELMDGELPDAENAIGGIWHSEFPNVDIIPIWA
jgi:hypothetical protein